MKPPEAPEVHSVAASLSGGHFGSPTAQLLSPTELAPSGYRAVAAAEPAPDRAVARLRAAAHRHLAVRTEFEPLLSAWHAAGLRVLVFKGFHLAEWVFDHPGERPYRDVDVLIDMADAAPAAELARAAGWQMPWSRRGSSTPYKHEEMQLVSPWGVAQLDVHRFAVHCASPLDRVQRRLTAAAWHDSYEAHLGSAPLRLLRPEDAILIGLVLNRFWSPDDLTLKPQDFRDLQKVTTKYSLTPEDLSKRAREIGCARTWRLFRSRCDPWEGQPLFGRPGFLRRHWYLAQIALERPHPHVEDVMMRALMSRSRPTARGSRGG